MEFHLHPQLAADTLFIADWSLSRVCLMNDARYPWIILVPRRIDISELFELSEDERAALMSETAHVARTLKELTGADKMNVAALGNIVPQLHVHVIARRIGDPAWPGPVWGRGECVPYGPAERDSFVERLRHSL